MNSSRENEPVEAALNDGGLQVSAGQMAIVHNIFELPLISGRDTVARSLHGIGNSENVRRRKIGLLCSIRCPGAIILKTLDLMQELRKMDVCIVSGFHSPLEQECLKVLLRGTCGIAICYARSLPKRIPAELIKPIEDGRLLILSAYDEKRHRATSETSAERNKIACILAGAVFVPYASPGGKIETLCREMLGFGKRVMTFGGAHNESLLAAGVSAIAIADELFSAIESG